MDFHLNLRFPLSGQAAQLSTGVRARGEFCIAQATNVAMLALGSKLPLSSGRLDFPRTMSFSQASQLWQLSTRVRARAWRLSPVLYTIEKSQFRLGYESGPSAVTDWIFKLERGSHVPVNWRSVRRASAGSRVESPVLATIEKSQCWPGY